MTKPFEDREVGELFRLAHADRDGNTMYVSGEMIQLIRKLVEERAHKYIAWRDYPAPGFGDYNEGYDYKRALNDFNIDPEDWPYGTD